MSNSRMSSDFYRRYRFVVLGPFLVLFVFVVYGAIRGVQNNSTDVSEWLPKHNRATEEFLWFASHFTGDDLLMVSWEGCTIDDPRAAQYATELRRPVEIDGTQVTLFRDVITPSEVLEWMQAPPLSLSRDEVLGRLEGWLVGPIPDNGSPTSCLLLLVTVEGFEHRHFMARHIKASANHVAGLSAEMMHVAGPTIDSVHIDRASGDSIILLSALCYLTCFTIMWSCFRSLRLAAVVFVTALFNQQLSVALIHYAGWRMDSVLLLIPPLMLVLTTAAGMHLINYYRDTIGEMGIEGATARAVRFGWSPCIMAATTTGFGLISMVISDLLPIQRFGWFATLALVAGTGVLFLLLPCLIELLPPKRWVRRIVERHEPTWLERFWGVVAARTQRHWLGILVVTALAFMLGAAGLPRIQTSVRVQDMFYKHAPIIRDYDWMESHVAPLVPIEVVIRIPKRADVDENAGDYPLLNRLRLVGEIESAIRRVARVHASVSAAKFAPALPAPYVEGERPSLRELGRRRAFERGLVQFKDSFMAAGWLRETENEELWRISARLKSTDANVDYARVMRDLRMVAEGILDSQTKADLTHITAVYTGGVPLINQAQIQLLNDLAKSFIMAFASIAIAMVFWLRSLKVGLLAMIPNVLPFVVVFGVLGWWGVDVDVGSMLTAATAMGTAVDDTFHFITCYQRGLSAGMDRNHAIHNAFQKTGSAMVQTSVICGFGLLVFAFSPFIPSVRFAWLMFTGLSVALIGATIVLPALLASPFARMPVTGPLARVTSEQLEV